ncbi:MAG: polysaccharide biosynthesis tyrosine autokinase [Acidimicrobiales bacterium]
MTTPSEEVPEPADIQSYLRVLNRRKVTIAVTTLVVLGLALAYSFIQSPSYTATTQVLVPEQGATSALQPANAVGQLPATASLQRTLADAVQFAQGDATKAAARAVLHNRAKVAVTASDTSDVLSFTYSSGNPAAAAATANGYAGAFISATQASQVAQYTQQVASLQSSITQLQSSEKSLPSGSQQALAAQSTITTLSESLQQLQAASQLTALTGPSVINAASVPTSPSSPKPVRNGLLGVVIGLLVGLGLAFLRDRLDDKVKSLRDAEEHSAGRPVVGTVPVVDSWRKVDEAHLALVEDPTSSVSEAYRTLRTAVQFLGIEGEQRVIGITSSTLGEGKSTTVANLAVSFARAGQRVVIVSCDFRRPRIQLFFGIDNRRGLTSVLLGEASLRECLWSVAGEPNLRVMPSGPIPPNPAEILSLDRIRNVVDTVARSADIVLIDCPPVLPVTDALLISRLCDTMLVVAAAVSTRKGDLSRTYELLAQVNAPLRGTIVNRVPHRGAYAPEYGYGYGYGYSTESDDAGQYRAGQDTAGRGPSANGGGPRRSRRDRLTEAATVEADERARVRSNGNGNGQRGADSDDLEMRP